MMGDITACTWSAWQY